MKAQEAGLKAVEFDDLSETIGEDRVLKNDLDLQNRDAESSGPACGGRPGWGDNGAGNAHAERGCRHPRRTWPRWVNSKWPRRRGIATIQQLLFWLGSFHSRHPRARPGDRKRCGGAKIPHIGSDSRRSRSPGPARGCGRACLFGDRGRFWLKSVDS